MIINFFVGQRTLEDCRIFIGDLIGRICTKPLFTSDELPHYQTVLLEHYSHLEEQPRTGKRGRPMQPKIVADAELKYATVHKTRLNGKVVKVERNVIFGDPKDIEKIIEESPVSKSINTSFIERANLTLRNHNRKLARKTLCFAKRKRSLEAQTSITVAYYNYSRPHRGLNRQGANGVREKRTPAMAANVIDRVWTISEVIEYPLKSNNN